MTKSFIEQSFQKLRSAEGAFELVQNFQNIQSRESINQSIDERYKDILAQYTKELDHIGAIFHAHKSSPPIYKNYPPIAGAIAWARDLYYRAKRPILRFKVRVMGSCNVLVDAVLRQSQTQSCVYGSHLTPGSSFWCTYQRIFACTTSTCTNAVAIRHGFKQFRKPAMRHAYKRSMWPCEFPLSSA